MIAHRAWPAPTGPTGWIRRWKPPRRRRHFLRTLPPYTVQINSQITLQHLPHKRQQLLIS